MGSILKSNSLLHVDSGVILSSFQRQKSMLPACLCCLGQQFTQYWLFDWENFQLATIITGLPVTAMEQSSQEVKSSESLEQRRHLIFGEAIKTKWNFLIAMFLVFKHSI